MSDAGYAVLPVHGLPELRPGDDLAALVATAVALQDGDVVVVTSKVVSKVEGRLLTVDVGEDREAARLRAVEAETVEVVARKGTTTIARTRHGLVLAAAGVDASNVPPDELALLPSDPDASAADLRLRLHALSGALVAVVISDTLGRAWRVGQVDAAIGAAGLAPVRDVRGTVDSFGEVLHVTEIAVADELVSAAELVKGKAAGIPVVIVRGLDLPDDGRGAAALVRPPEQDLFRLGTAEARQETVALSRPVRAFSDAAVDRDAVHRAVAAALTAPAPHDTTPWRFVVVDERRQELLDAMAAQRMPDLLADGVSEASIALRLGSEDVLRRAPLLVLPFLVRDGEQRCPDAGRTGAEEPMLLAAAGAGVQKLIVQLAADGLGSAWLSTTVFCPDIVRDVLDLPADWEPLGVVAIGYAASLPSARPRRSVKKFLLER
jgi:coenzyme F420-0:L-glutamate ligase/coenzyme F420-1:gamma-L-glutamate ligase